VNHAEWLAAREAEIDGMWDLLGATFVDEPEDGIETPPGAIAPSDVAEMLYCRTGIPGWRVWISLEGELEILPPLRDPLATDGTEGVL